MPCNDDLHARSYHRELLLLTAGVADYLQGPLRSDNAPDPSLVMCADLTASPSLFAPPHTAARAYCDEVLQL
jgi:hypothetical protein